MHIGADQFGVDGHTPANIMAAIKAEPDAAMKLREVELRQRKQVYDAKMNKPRRSGVVVI